MCVVWPASCSPRWHRRWNFGQGKIPSFPARIPRTYRTPHFPGVRARSRHSGLIRLLTAEGIRHGGDGAGVPCAQPERMAPSMLNAPLFSLALKSRGRAAPIIGTSVQRKSPWGESWVGGHLCIRLNYCPFRDGFWPDPSPQTWTPPILSAVPAVSVKTRLSGSYLGAVPNCR